MIAGSSKVDITPSYSVWMEGMIRTHKSEGVHDPLFARALVLSNSQDLSDAFAVVSLDVCALASTYADTALQTLARRTGIPADHIILAASHTHSGPATLGIFNPMEVEYSDDLLDELSAVLEQAIENAVPVSVGCASGREDTISHYRRFLDENGKVVMIWESDPSVHPMQVQGASDPEVGVLKIVNAANPDKVVCTLFNHAGHPNVMSGENYLLSADYPGVAQRLLEEELGGVAQFTNGAQGTVDIDNWKYRDWAGMEQIGKTLFDAVLDTAQKAVPSDSATVRGSSTEYDLPSRKITDGEIAWAEDIIEQTGGKMQAVADGVGDDYKALLYRKLRAEQDEDIRVMQACFAVGDTAFISFPGELFTEIGMKIKTESPFAHTYIIGLANGYAGYVPTREAIAQGGYEVDTRRADDSSEEIIIQNSLALLAKVYAL
ncbi:MAG: neutral/alkaline non-lysosomal ceramidase N-terminal domain-containing protein [Armatimonadota bacterium]